MHPDLQKKAVQMVITQAKMLAKELMNEDNERAK